LNRNAATSSSSSLAPPRSTRSPGSGSKIQRSTLVRPQPSPGARCQRDATATHWVGPTLPGERTLSRPASERGLPLRRGCQRTRETSAWGSY
jgi:hypothetical protein